jgi:amidohydrolase
MTECIKRIVQENINDIVELRRLIHRYPELGGKEIETTKRLQAFFKSRGLTLHPIADLTGGYLFIDAKSNKTICFRADIDALPIVEATGALFTSESKGTMHACGHDVHTAVAAGVALTLKKLKESLKCNVIVLFQPAEECNPIGGALPIIETGFLRGNNICEMYGLHVWPSYPVGEIALKTGALMGSSDRFVVEIHGKKSHAAEPHNGVDSISIASEIINALVHKIRRELNPFDVFLISIGSISSNGRYNIICDNVKLEGTIRTVSEPVRDFVHKRICALSESIAASYCGRADVEIHRGYDVVQNDFKLTESFVNFARMSLGNEKVHQLDEPSLIGEDFSRYSQEVPSLYFFMGCENDYPLHSDHFLPKEEVIQQGVELVAGYLLQRQ